MFFYVLNLDFYILLFIGDFFLITKSQLFVFTLQLGYIYLTLSLSFFCVMHGIWLSASANTFILFVLLHVGFCKSFVLVVIIVNLCLGLFLDMKILA
jgi:hypothetical protein